MIGLVGLLALLIEPLARPEIPPLVRQVTFRGMRRLLQMAGYPCCCAKESSTSSSASSSSSQTGASVVSGCLGCTDNDAPSQFQVVISGTTSDSGECPQGDCDVYDGTYVCTIKTIAAASCFWEVIVSAGSWDACGCTSGGSVNVRIFLSGFIEVQLAQENQAITCTGLVYQESTSGDTDCVNLSNEDITFNSALSTECDDSTCLLTAL